MDRPYVVVRSLLFSTLTALSFTALICVACSDITKPGETESKIDAPQWPLGQWRLEDDKAQSTIVTLYPDGSALATSGTIGSWYFAENQLYILWMDGWMNVIRKERDGYAKMGFAPGVASDSTPSNQSKAVKISDQSPPAFVTPSTPAQ